MHAHVYNLCFPETTNQLPDAGAFSSTVLCTMGQGMGTELLCGLHLRRYSHPERIALVLCASKEAASKTSVLLTDTIRNHDPQPPFSESKVVVADSGMSTTERSQLYAKAHGAIVVAPGSTICADILHQRFAPAFLSCVCVMGGEQWNGALSFATLLIRNRVSRRCNNDQTKFHASESIFVLSEIGIPLLTGGVVAVINPSRFVLFPRFRLEALKWFESKERERLDDGGAAIQEVVVHADATKASMERALLQCATDLLVELRSASSAYRKHCDHEMTIDELLSGQIDHHLRQIQHSSPQSGAAFRCASSLSQLQRLLCRLNSEPAGAFLLELQRCTRTVHNGEPPHWLLCATSNEAVQRATDRVFRVTNVEHGISVEPTPTVDPRLVELRRIIHRKYRSLQIHNNHATVGQKRSRSTLEVGVGKTTIFVVCNAMWVTTIAAVVSKRTVTEFREDQFREFVIAYQLSHSAPLTTEELQENDDESRVDGQPHDHIPHVDVTPSRLSMPGLHDVLLSMASGNSLRNEKPADLTSLTTQSDDDSVEIIDDEDVALFDEAQIVSCRQSAMGGSNLDGVLQHCAWAEVRCTDQLTIVVLDQDAITVPFLLLHKGCTLDIILFNYNLRVLRHIEVALALGVLALSTQITLMGSGQSVEKHIMQSEVQRERHAFKRLAEFRSSMVTRMEARTTASSELQRELASAARSGDSRRKVLTSSSVVSDLRLGDETADNSPLVVFDEREFRSSLPLELFRKGLRVVPLTLLRGDYILSPSVALERKAIPDLLQSLQSGRLNNQLQSMEKQYRSPCLLIELDKDLSFQWIMNGDSPLRFSHLTSTKLVRATTSTPNVSIIWARSSSHAAGMIADLKRSSFASEDVDPAEEALTQGPADVAKEERSHSISILQALPGVTNSNVASLLTAAGSLRGLAEMTESMICQLLGTDNGGKLFRFLHTPI